MERKILTKLQKWKNSPNRKPLLIEGARQVGKTYILKEFGHTFFESCVYFHLERNRTVRTMFEEETDVHKLLAFLEAESDSRIIPNETLIILDEIQTCPAALTSLKYFCEEAPEYCICGAGSLLGLAIHREGSSFPVGKVNTIKMYPMDFEEFLIAVGELFLRDEISRSAGSHAPLNKALHDKAMSLYREYLVVGGMPEAIAEYISGGSFVQASQIQDEILDNYISDMAKYATHSEAVRVRACYESIPAQLAKDNKKFQYKVVQRGGSAKIFGTALEWLMDAGIVLKCECVSRGDMPLEAYKELSAFKIYMSDVGLLTAKSGMSKAEILAGYHGGFAGAITENYVASQLVASGHRLYYWSTSDSHAELDFLTSNDDGIIAIEVKSGDNVHARSLSVFNKKYAPASAVRVSTKNFGMENGITSVPLYAVWTM